MSLKMPQTGDLVANKYRLIAKLGEGGYGIVYRAHQETMGRDVALKMLRPEASRLPDEVERFRREVFNASTLKHPNTITLYDYGQLPNGSFYIAMEYLDGKNMGLWLRDMGPLGHEVALELTEQILRSVREAHSQDILHRDIKPENLFVVELGEGERMVKVLDFGLSKAIGSRRGAQRTLTKEGQVQGTPNYMSPEQACAMKLEPASDIYAIGLISWEMLTGKTAFVGPTAVDVLLKQVNEPTPELPQPLRHTLLADFIARATRKDPMERFANGADALDWISQRRERARRSQLQRSIDSATHHQKPRPALQVTPSEHSGMIEVEPWFSFKDPADIDIAELEMRLAQLPMVGRQRELHELLRWGRQSMLTGGILRLHGDMGVGKSRLTDEWLRHMEMNAITILRGRYHEDGAAMEGIREALAPLFDPAHRDILRAQGALMPEEDTLDLRRIIAPSPQEEPPARSGGQDWALAVIEHALYGLARQRPTILLLEDLHWADDFSLRLVERWKEEMATRALPLVLVFTQREDAHSPRAPSRRSAMHTRASRPFTYSHDVYLERLRSEEAAALLDDLLPFEPELRERIIQTARGNPLYLTQIVRYLIEEELLERPEGATTWGLKAHDEETEQRLLPPDLRALLMQRVKTQLSQHRLSAVLQQLLIRGLVLGNRFELRLLKEFLRVEGRGDLEAYLDDALEAFTQSGVLLSTVIEGRSGLEFGYELLRDPLMAEHDDLSALHALAAQAKKNYYKQRDPLLLDIYAHEIAHHWSEAHQQEKAFAWLMRAARSSEQIQDFRQALEYLRMANTRLSRELDPNGEHLLEIRLAEGRMFRFLGEFGPAEDALRDAIEETRRVGDTVGEALTGEAMAGVLTLVTRYGEASDFYRRVEGLYEQFGERAGVLRCQLGLAEIARFCGNYKHARARFEHISEAARALGDPGIQARCMFGLAQCDFAAGDLDAAIDGFRRARKRAETREDAMLCSEADIELAMCMIYTAHIENAIATAKAALEVKQSIGDTLGQAHAHLVLALCLRRTHRLTEARHHAQRARELNDRLGHIYGIAKSVQLEAEIHWVSGNYVEGLAALEESERLHLEIGDMHGLTMTALDEALCHVEMGRAQQAKQACARAEQLLERHELDMYRPLHLMISGMIFELEGNLEDAISSHHEAIQRGDAMGNRQIGALATISICKAHVLMGDFHAARAEAPLALSRAEATGQAHALMFALSLQALIARLDRQAEVLASSLRRLRVLNENASELNNMRIPHRLVQLAHTVRLRLPGERAFPVVLAAVEIIRALGDTETADHLAREILQG